MWVCPTGTIVRRRSVPKLVFWALRKGLELFANIRPAYLYPELKDRCPLRDEVIGEGFDMVIMRELTGGLYFGKRFTEEVNGVRRQPIL